MATEKKESPAAKDRSYRVDSATHDLLMSESKHQLVSVSGKALGLPEPVFPQYPKKCGDVELPAKCLRRSGKNPYYNRTNIAVVRRAMRGWLYPYVRSVILPGDFHPIVAFFFTEYKCNLDCHYCWAYNNNVKGMTEEVARYSIDWLHDTGCRVLALMGGEVLLRPRFVHKVVYYAAKKGFWIYLPTNGRLMRKEVIDWLGDAGVASVNLAVDSVAERKELPKALDPIRSYFEFLIKKQYIYNFCVFFNINITRINLDDVRQLTEIAHDAGIATDYHINESPMLEQKDFKHKDDNSTFIQEEDWPKIDELIDWIIEKHKSGYKMVNSVQRLQEMKAFMRGAVQNWDCRAGQNTIIIRTDGTLAPCFPTYSATYDWGTVGRPNFDTAQLADMKRKCQQHCFSTLNHNLAYCYNTRRVIKWVFKQAVNGFRGTTGSFED